MKTLRFLTLPFFLVLTVHPWVLFGFRGPESDATLLLLANAGMYGMVKLPWYFTLFTSGAGLFIVPLLWIIPDMSFFPFGSLCLALGAIAATWGFWRMSRAAYRNRWVAYVGTFLIAVHPMIHQFHYYWMTEGVYIAFLVAAVYALAQYLAEARRKDLLLSALWGGLAVLMRPQAGLFFPIASVALLAGHLSSKAGLRKQVLIQIVRDTAILISIGLLVTFPFRLFNFVQYQTWALNDTLGWNICLYTQAQNRYSPKNGAASARLFEWSTLMVQNVNHLDRLNKEPWVKVIENELQASAHVVTDGFFRYKFPMLAAYFFTSDRQASDRFSTQIFKESFRANPNGYWAWLMTGRWYFTGLSENPQEAQRDFQHVDQNTRFSLSLKDREIVGYGIGGLAFKFPWMLKIYDPARTLYAKSMTVLKKVTTVLLPFLLWHAFRRGPRATAWMLALCFALHAATALSLAMILGFHHRYGAPFEVFTLIYALYGLDVLLDRSFPRS